MGLHCAGAPGPNDTTNLNLKIPNVWHHLSLSESDKIRLLPDIAFWGHLACLV